MILFGAARALRMADFEAVARLDGADSNMITCRWKLRVAGTSQVPASNCLASPRGAPRSSRAMSQVLMFDNAALFRMLEGSFLRRGGWGIVRARNTGEVISMARQRHPDLILLDADRTDVDGSACLGALKADPLLSSIPVLIVTSDQDASRYSRAGADVTLTRPLEPRALEHALCSLGRVPRRAGQRSTALLPVRIDSPAGVPRGSV